MEALSIQNCLSANIKKARKALKLTQEGLAERSDLSTQMINDIEGCRKWPSALSLAKIADALGLEASELFVEIKPTIPFEARVCVCQELKGVFESAIDAYLEQYKA